MSLKNIKIIFIDWKYKFCNAFKISRALGDVYIWLYFVSVSLKKKKIRLGILKLSIFYPFVCLYCISIHE